MSAHAGVRFPYYEKNRITSYPTESRRVSDDFPKRGGFDYFSSVLTAEQEGMFPEQSDICWFAAEG